MLFPLLVEYFVLIEAFVDFESFTTAYFTSASSAEVVRVHCVPGVWLLSVILDAAFPVTVKSPVTVKVLPASNERVFPGCVQVKSPFTVLSPEMREVPVPVIVRLLKVFEEPEMLPANVTLPL